MIEIFISGSHVESPLLQHAIEQPVDVHVHLHIFAADYYNSLIPLPSPQKKVCGVFPNTAVSHVNWQSRAFGVISRVAASGA